MDVMAKITEAIDLLNSIDEYGSGLVGKLSELDSKEQDLLHHIENTRISPLWCYFMVKKIKDIRIERRRVKNDMELMSKYNEIKSKMTSKENRQFILAELHKREKMLNTTYKNRQYSEEDIRKILKGIDTDDKDKQGIQNKEGS